MGTKAIPAPHPSLTLEEGLPLKTSEVAEMLSVSPRAIRRLILFEGLPEPACLSARLQYWRLGEVYEWLEKKRGPNHPLRDSWMNRARKASAAACPSGRPERTGGSRLGAGALREERAAILAAAKLLTYADVADLMGITRPQLKRLERRGQFPRCVRISRHIHRWRREWLADWLPCATPVGPRHPTQAPQYMPACPNL